jgi:hypothetical protein
MKEKQRMKIGFLFSSLQYKKRISDLEAEVDRLRKSAGYTGGSPRSLPPLPPSSANLSSKRKKEVTARENVLMEIIS